MSNSFENPQLEREAIAQSLSLLEKPAERILSRLKDSLNRGDYGLIIGDDISGRLLAELIEKTTAKIYAKNRMEKPVFTKVLSRRNLAPEEKERRAGKVAAYLQAQLADRDPKRAMVVTEQLETGDSIEPVLLALKNLGIEADLLTLHVTTNRFKTGSFNKYPIRLINADSSSAERAMRHRHEWSGVKRVNDDLDAIAAIEDSTPESELASQQLSIMADRIFSSYEKQ